MFETSKLFAERKFPKWFQSHPVFNEIKQIKKVFPGIGLPNSESEMGLGGVEVAQASATALFLAVQNNLRERFNALAEFVAARPTMADTRKAHSDKCIALMQAVYNQIANNSRDLIQVNNNRVSIKLSADVLYDNHQVYRQNESFFRVYNKINILLRERHFASLGPIENLEEFKTFSADNIPNQNYKVVFSSDGVDGAWDIATMSMRGITSCQSWDGDYRHCVIGSVIDPFVGIIYLTSGAEQKYGTKMMKRSLVRFVVNEETKKPYLIIDYMYPSLDARVLGQFKAFLKDKTNDKFGIEYGPDLDAEQVKTTYIPLNDIRKKLRSFSEDGKYEPVDDLESIQSYQDVRIENKAGNKDFRQSQFEKNAKKKERKFVDNFVKAVQDAIKDIDIDNVPDNLQPALKKFKANKDRYNHPIIPIATAIANSIVADIDRNNYSNSNLYIKRVYARYFTQKTKILNDVKTKLTKEINGQLKLKTKIKSSSFLNLMKVLSPIMDGALKKALYEYHNPKKIIPLPLP